MFICFGKPDLLASINQAIDIDKAKKEIRIAILDDNKFHLAEALSNHSFCVRELGHDIRDLSSISEYPIVVSDVSGVARALGSDLEGAHLINEIRKKYPDKFLIAYTGMSHDVRITNALMAADRRIQKDASIEVWIKELESGIEEVANPRIRWIRMRRSLIDRGMEIFDILRLEQAFIRALKKSRPNLIEMEAGRMNLDAELKDVVIKFAATAVVNIIDNAMVGG